MRRYSDGVAQRSFRDQSNDLVHFNLSNDCVGYSVSLNTKQGTRNKEQGI